MRCLRRRGDTNRRVGAPANARRVAISCLLTVVVIALCLNHYTHLYPIESITKDTLESTEAKGNFYQPVTKNGKHIVYGHVHMTKTAGTEINGELANLYERVCGHKGYSFDFYKFNQHVQRIINRTGEVFESGIDDIYTKHRKNFNRGRVPFDIMEEIGYEDCDYVSQESGWKWWNRTDLVFQGRYMDLHVPCRDPISHLMSQCNHMGHRFNCSAGNLEEEIEKCNLSLDRFGMGLKEFPRFDLYCFNPIPIGPYIDYMGTLLQAKKYDPDPYAHRSTNKKHKQEDECIWESNEAKEKVSKILLKNYDYYKFCDECLGSEKDLLANMPVKTSKTPE